MRKPVLVALVLAAALAAATVALAAAQQTNTGYVRGSSSKAGAPTSVHVFFKVTPGPDGKIHKHSAKIDIIFPKGVGFHDKVKPYCRATTAAQFAAGACKSSLLAKGRAIADGSHIGLGTLHVTIYAYNRHNGLILYAVSKEGAPPQVFFPTLKGNVLHTDTSNITNPSFQVDETLFDLTIPKISKGHGKHRIWYATLPRTCPRSHRWTGIIRFHLENDQFKPIGTVDAVSHQRCHR